MIDGYHFEVLGQPFSKARPRVTSRGTYTPAKQRKNAEMLAAFFKQQIPVPMTESVAVEMVFYRKGKQRIDLDNLVKQVLDAANGVCFVDDVQVVRLTATLELDNENPRTVLDLRAHATSMPRGDARDLKTPCVTCGNEIAWRSYASRPDPPKFCDIGCQRRQDRTCEHCGESFYPNSGPQIFCNQVCAKASDRLKQAVAARRRAAALPPNLCRNCGALLARRASVWCRDCWLSADGQSKKKSRADILAEEAAA